MTQPQDALTRLRSRAPVFGMMQLMPLPTVTELAIWSGYDFVMLDCEHGIVNEPAYVTCLQAMNNKGTAAGVRVAPRDFRSVGRYLNFGADIIMMPDVHTAEDAAAFVAAATFGPKGTRSSSGATRALHYGADLQDPERAPVLFATIEGKQGLANVAAIAATPGLSGLMIGPSDLSADLDCSNDYAAPAYKAAVEKIAAAANKAGLLLGNRPSPGYSVDQLVSAGYTFIIASADITALRDGFRTHLTAARKK